MATPNFSSLLLLLLLLCVPLLSLAEIKTLTITSDPRPLILLESFGFSLRGSVDIDVSDVTFTSPLSPPDPSLMGFALLSQQNLIQLLFSNPNPRDSCILSSPYSLTLFTFLDLTPPPFNSLNRSFPVFPPDDYTLFFINCAPSTEVSMAVRTVIFNSLPDGSRDYLPLGQSPLPSLYTLFAVAYFAFFALWIYLCLLKNRRSSHRIHLIMAALLIAKALHLVFAAEDRHLVKVTGTPRGWDYPFYFFRLVKAVLLFTVVVLIGTGWSFLKPFLQGREKKLLMIVIPLQVIANVASVVVGETGPFVKDWAMWMQVFLFIDVACCVAIMFPIVWSIRSLRETAKTDGKARRNLAKLMLFRRFYVVVVGYLYFTRIVVFAAGGILSYEYRWVSVAMEEAVTLAFYVFMFYMFRPKERNEYFVLDEEEEVAAQRAIRDEEFEL